MLLGALSHEEFAALRACIGREVVVSGVRNTHRWDYGECVGLDSVPFTHCLRMTGVQDGRGRELLINNEDDIRLAGKLESGEELFISLYRSVPGGMSDSSSMVNSITCEGRVLYSRS